MLRTSNANKALKVRTVEEIRQKPVYVKICRLTTQDVKLLDGFGRRNVMVAA